MKDGNSYSCLMAYFDNSIVEKLKLFIKSKGIKNLDQEGQSICDHVTIMYGIDENEPIQTKEALKKYNKSNISLSFENFGLFKKDEHDVFIINVKSDDLNNLHKIIEDNVKCSGNEYPDYHAHCTLAYIEKNTISEDDFKSWKKFSESIVTDDLIFSNKDEKYTKMKVKDRTIQNKLDSIKDAELDNSESGIDKYNKAGDLGEMKKKKTIIDEKLEKIDEAKTRTAYNPQLDPRKNTQLKYNQNPLRTPQRPEVPSTTITNPLSGKDQPDTDPSMKPGSLGGQEAPKNPLTQKKSMNTFEQDAALFFEKNWAQKFLQLFNELSKLMTFNGTHWEVVSRRFLKSVREEMWMTQCVEQEIMRSKRGRPGIKKEAVQVPFIGDSPLISGMQNMVTSLITPIWDAIKGVLNDIWEGIKTGIIARKNAKEAMKTIQILKEYKAKIENIDSSAAVGILFQDFKSDVSNNFYNSYDLIEPESSKAILNHVVDRKQNEVINTIKQWIEQVDFMIEDIQEKYLSMNKKAKYHTKLRFGSEKSTSGGRGNPEELLNQK